MPSHCFSSRRSSGGLAKRRRRFLCAIAMIAGVTALARDEGAYAQAPDRPMAGEVLLTIFLKHDQTKTLGEINAKLRAQHFYERFPPQGTKVVSWYVMMGIGQVVTLRLPAERLREVNKTLEETAWGAFSTEFFPTYDYGPIAAGERKSPPPMP